MIIYECGICKNEVEIPEWKDGVGHYEHYEFQMCKSCFVENVVRKNKEIEQIPKKSELIAKTI